MNIIDKKLQEFREKWEGAHIGATTSLSSRVAEEMIKDISSAMKEVQEEAFARFTAIELRKYNAKKQAERRNRV